MFPILVIIPHINGTSNLGLVLQKHNYGFSYVQEKGLSIDPSPM